MPLFRHKPAEVEARQFIGSNWREIEVWSQGRIRAKLCDHDKREPGQDPVVTEMELEESDGPRLQVLLTDWIVKTGDDFRIFNEEVFGSRFEPISP